MTDRTKPGHGWHEEAPLNEDGYPVHPELGYPICGRPKAGEPYEESDSGYREDVPYCTLAAAWGLPDERKGPGVACRRHGGNAPRGEDNANFKHGAYSKFRDFMFDSLTEEEREALDALDFGENAEEWVEDVIREAYSKYLRTGDDRFLKEVRQWAKEFGVLEAEPERVEHSGEVEGGLSLDDETRELALRVIREQQREESE